jgi:hypothetical protein
MTRTFGWVLAIATIATLSSSALALAASGWDGTWAGAWGGDAKQTTSITVSGDRVVSYSYQGVSHPVKASSVTAAKITYEDQGNSVTLTKTGEKTAHATLRSGSNNASAELTLQ